MKKSDYMPAIQTLVDALERLHLPGSLTHALTDRELRQLHKVKNWLRSSQSEQLSSTAVKRSINVQKKWRGIAT